MTRKNLYQGPCPGYAGSWGYMTDFDKPVVGARVKLIHSYSSDPRATAVIDPEGQYRVTQVHSLYYPGDVSAEITVSIALI